MTPNFGFSYIAKVWLILADNGKFKAAHARLLSDRPHQRRGADCSELEGHAHDGAVGRIEDCERLAIEQLRPAIYYLKTAIYAQNAVRLDTH